MVEGLITSPRVLPPTLRFRGDNSKVNSNWTDDEAAMPIVAAMESVLTVVSVRMPYRHICRTVDS